MPRLPRYLAATALWVAAVGLLAYATIDREQIVADWGLLCALVAHSVTDSLFIAVSRDKVRVMIEDDDNVDRIVTVVDALHHGRENLRRLH